MEREQYHLQHAGDGAEEECIMLMRPPMQSPSLKMEDEIPRTPTMMEVKYPILGLELRSVSYL